MQKKPLKVLDIFSGIGGFSLGLERAGMETVAFCEIEPFCQSIIEKHWPKTRIFTDVKILNKELLSRSGVTGINVIAGGFPCQDISCAGKQRGIEGERSGLWKEYKRLINELRPDYAIIENVANLRSRGLATVLQDLWEIGYDVQWHCIPASSVGAPHRRDRIWIIAYPTVKGLERCQRQSAKGYRPRSAKCCKEFSDTDSTRCNCYQGTSTRSDGEEGWQECTAYSITSGNCAAGEGFPLYETGSGKETKTEGLQNCETILADTNSARQVGIPGADRTLTQKSRCRGTNSQGSRSDDRGNHKPCTNAEMADTNSAGLQGHGRFEETRQILSQEAVSLLRSTTGIAQWGIEPNIPRLKDERLNPDWVEWLMGFPEGWTSGGTRKQRLVALGNAVVPQIPELIGTAIVKYGS
ncbi:MAG: (cytosine-5-)-methyltransferase [Rickettsiaceae bacterium]|jgi:DNA-cytosine methyltransferase|nr:(cytosine-5-)-methyltransferase [Rickettsiaceae bacterium]